MRYQNHHIVSIWLFMVAALAAVGAYWLTVDKQSSDGWGSESCANFKSNWIGREGRNVISILQDLALQQQFADKSREEICTLEVVLEKVDTTDDSLLELSTISKLASALARAKRLEEAKQVLGRGLEVDGPDDIVSRIREVQILLQLAAVSAATGDSGAQERYLSLARSKSDDIDAGSLFREKIFLSEIEFFESCGEYKRAISSAEDLLRLRLEWANSMPTKTNEELIGSARDELNRLLLLANQSGGEALAVTKDKSALLPKSRRSCKPPS